MYDELSPYELDTVIPGTSTTYREHRDAQRGRHARAVYDLDAIPEDPALATEPECCS